MCHISWEYQSNFQCIQINHLVIVDQDSNHQIQRLVYSLGTGTGTAAGWTAFSTGTRGASSLQTGCSTGGSRAASGRVSHSSGQPCPRKTWASSTDELTEVCWTARLGEGHCLKMFRQPSPINCSRTDGHGTLTGSDALAIQTSSLQLCWSYKLSCCSYLCHVVTTNASK